MKNKNIILKAAIMAMLFTMMMCLPVFATTAAPNNYQDQANALLSPATFILYIIEGIVVIVGVVFVLWGVFNLAKALPAHDQSGISSGVLWIVGGIICIGVGSVCAVLTNNQFGA